MAYLGVQTVIWLGEGVVDDETGGHIDNLACFVKPGVVALTWTDDKRDPQYAVSRDALERLAAARDARGRRLAVIKLPHAGAAALHGRRDRAACRCATAVRGRLAGMRLAASYVNFYIANGGIVMPLLDPRTDKAAAAQLKRAFPGRKVVGVPAREILLGGGNIHCITQQVPRDELPSAMQPDGEIEWDSERRRDATFPTHCASGRARARNCPIRTPTAASAGTRTRRWPPPPRTSRGSRNCNTRCTPTAASRCWSRCRPSTAAARTAPSAACLAHSTPRAARLPPSRAPSAEELRHDFLWRIHRHAPPRGEIGGIQPLALRGRAHRARQRPGARGCLEPPLRPDQRFRALARRLRHPRCKNFPAHQQGRAARSVSQDRLGDRRKNWKFDTGDLEKRQQWAAYTRAFEAMFARCSTDYAPWYIVPANRKWFRDFAVSQLLIYEFEQLPLRFPGA